MTDFLINMGIILIFGIVYGVAIIWVDGIDNMKENHPDYYGEDFP
jgi:hypothetical protein